jgi:hypothetical protein
VETQLLEFLVLDEGLLTIEHVFKLRRRNMTDGFKEPAVVEPMVLARALIERIPAGLH